MATAESFVGDFDQRHTLNVYLHQRLTAKMSVSAKFRAGSNVPVPGYFEGNPVTDLVASDTRNTVRLQRTRGSTSARIAR